MTASSCFVVVNVNVARLKSRDSAGVIPEVMHASDGPCCERDYTRYIDSASVRVDL